jgi:hypothetical protein
MLGSQAVNLLKQRLGRGVNASSAFDTWMQDELTAAQTRLETLPTLPWFLLSERAYIDLSAGEERVVLPSDFLRENEDDDMQIEETVTASYTELRKTHIDQLRVRYPDEETGLPKQYSFQGAYFRIRPVPDLSTYRLWMTYFQKDTAFSTGAENNWLKHYPDLLIAEAGIPLATTLQNATALSLFQNTRTEQVGILTTNEIAKTMANFDPNPED